MRPLVVTREDSGLLLRESYNDAMVSQGRWTRWVPAALLTVCTVVAFVLQFVALVVIGGEWAGNHDVASGGCGWYGTCSDAGVLSVTMWCALALFLAELVIGGLLGTVKRLAVAIMVGCLVSWAVAFQDALVISQTAERGLDDQGRAQLFLTWGTRALMVDGAIVVICCLAWFVATRFPLNRPHRVQLMGMSGRESAVNRPAAN